MSPRLREAHRLFDIEVGQLVREARTQVTVPCAPGCDACCYDIAWCITPEAIELAERVRSMPKKRREEVLEGLAAWFRGMRAAGLDPRNKTPDLRTYHRARLRCPLLDAEAHRCMVYDVRPISCRGYFVIAPDARGCANRANEPTVVEIIVAEQGMRAVARMSPPGTWVQEHLLPVLLAEALGLSL